LQPHSLVVSFDELEEQGHPLGQMQKIGLLQDALVTFDGYNGRLLGELTKLLRETPTRGDSRRRRRVRARPR
jgi:hypothetical protein